ncbi:MAG: HD domain-containing phosphohydrolase [Elusimicrobiota bacterium]
MTFGFWILIAAAAALLSALVWALREIYALRLAAEPAAETGKTRGLPQERLDELLTMLLALHDYGVSRTGNVSHEEFCSLVIEKACRLLNSTRGTVMLFDEEEKVLSVVASRNAAITTTPKLKLKPGEGVAGRAFEAAKPIFVLEPTRDPRYVASDPKRDSDEPFLSIPMMLKSKPIGVLNVHDTGGALTPDDTKLKFLMLLGGEAALALHHQKMYDDLQIFYFDMVQMLARAAGAKDAYGQDHSERSRRYANAVAKELGLPDQMMRYVEYSTMLHGIGKIGVDQNLLSKPGKLTPAEFEQIKKHTSIGHRILQPVKFFGPVAQMVLYHQEWYNGKGYPEGLKGEEIPLGSRIVAVIIAWEAMNSDRPYRKALPRDAAIDQLQKGADTQFDPKVVEAFLTVEARLAREEAAASGG